MTERRHFAVLLCSHNGAPFIDTQLDSLAHQTRAPDLVAIHDWGSSDGTREKVRSWIAGAEHPSRYTLTSHDEVPGACASFLRALELLLRASPAATHVFFCDQDDCWFAEKIAIYDELLDADTSAPQLIYSDAQLMDADGRVSHDTYYHRRGSPLLSPSTVQSPDIALVNPAIGMTCCLARPLAELLVENRGAPWPMHDWGAVLLCRAYGMESRFIPQPLVAYRQHAGNEIGVATRATLLQRVMKVRARLDELASLRAWCLGLPPAVRPVALKLIPRSRGEAMANVLRSSNLRYWFRPFLALLVLCFWKSRPSSG